MSDADAMSEEEKRPRLWLLVGAPILLCFAALGFGTWLTDPMIHASREDTFAIRQGMLRTDVTELLGVMYDDYPVGKFPGVDVIADKMHDGTSVATICCWRVARSRDRFWVGFDAKGAVVDTMEQLGAD